MPLQPPESDDEEPHCLLETWGTSRMSWVHESSPHRSVAAATAAATKRGLYRVVLVNGDRRVEIDAFAIF